MPPAGKRTTLASLREFVRQTLQSTALREEATNMQTAPILIGALVALIATSVGALVTLFGQWLTRRSEERRHLRQLIVQAAVENWRLASSAAEKAGARRYPLDAFILHLLKLGEVLETRPLTADRVRAKLREAHEIDRAVFPEIEKFTDELKRPTN